MKHLTEDIELLERYAMRKLDPAEQAGIETHLTECAQCRELVAHESLIAGGVRSYAREQLKKRLQERVHYTHETVVPWPHILSTAAVVLIVAGLGYYYTWWGSDPSPVSLDEIRVERELFTEESRESRAIPPRPPDRAGETGAGGTSRPKPSEARSEPSRAETLKKKDVAPFPAASSDEKESRAEEIAIPGGAGRGEQRWIQGYVVQGARSRAEALKSLSVEEDAEVRDRPPAAEMAMSEIRKTQLVSISQQPLSKIPAEKMFRQDKTGIPAIVEMENDVLSLTLFSDTLELKGKNIRIEPVATDSILIMIDGTHVAYKIPRGWTKDGNVFKLTE